MAKKLSDGVTRESRTDCLSHSIQCLLSQGPDQSPRKRRKADCSHRRKTSRTRPKIIQSVINSCRVCVFEALRSGTDINLQDDDGYTALMVAVEVDSLEMIELLINQGSDATARNNWGETSLYLAVSRGGTNVRAIVRRLLACSRSAVNLPSFSGCSSLFRAAGSYHQDTLAIVRDLIDANADLDARGSDPDVLNGRQMTPFELSVTVGSFHVCQLLYLAGCEIGVVHAWMRGNSFPRILRQNSNWMGTVIGWATQPRMLSEWCVIRIRRAIVSSGMGIRHCTENDLRLPVILAKLVLEER